MTHSTQERGGVLLYAVIAVAFLSGLSLYLQKMSDPKIFQANDTQKILTSEYLSDSIKTLLENTAYNNPSLPKTEDEIIDHSTNNVTASFISSVTETLNNQEKIYLFKTENLLIASAEKNKNINDTSTSFEILKENQLSVKSLSIMNYNIKTINTLIDRDLEIILYINLHPTKQTLQ